MVDKEWISGTVSKAAADVKLTDIHTHIYPPVFGELLLWGVDELLTYHYLVAEMMRWVNIPYSDYWNMPKQEQADLIWKTLFIEHSPYSESCRGVLTVLNELGLDVSSRNLESFRAYFAKLNVEDYVEKAFDVAGVESVVMTNDPFDDLERPTWLEGKVKRSSRFHAALRLDALINAWPEAVPSLKSWGYEAAEDFSGKTIAEVKRFLTDWIDRMDALYMAVSLPPSFAFPEDSDRGRLIEDCILPVAREKNIPFAPMVGVRKLINPELKLAGDGAGKASVEVIEYLCREYPENKFLVTLLTRETQHELCVLARKFRNLMIFGCWWFLNNPVLIEEMTRMRFELLGSSIIPQHSDSRVLDQLIYKWSHSRKIIARVLTDKYNDLRATGWTPTEEEIKRDVADIFGGNFWRFIGRNP